MDTVKKNVGLLSVCQGLLLTNNSLMIATTGLAGLAIAPSPALATVPVTTYVVGSAITTMASSLLMKRIGRVNGFTLGSLFGIVGALLCGIAVHYGSFLGLCLGTAVIGFYNATGQYYRFAAADMASTDFKSKAISLVLAGGILGGILGPETSKLTKDLLQPAFTASFLSLTLFCLIAIVLQRMMDIPPPSAQEQKASGRPLREIVMQPAYLVAVLSGMVGYGVMNLLMTATPLAMVACEHPFRDAAFVIQWHVIGMFLPSFFTGGLIKRFGVINIMLTGVVLNLACVAAALSGLEVANFLVAMVLLGVGWNFMYIGGTTLLTETYAPAERAKAQGFNDSAIFVTMAVTAVSSGALFNQKGWEIMNLGAVPFLVLTATAMLWLGVTRRRAANV